MRANLHVHSAFSHDSRGTVEEIVAAAKKVGTQVVMFTEHPADHYDYFRDGHRGARRAVDPGPRRKDSGLSTSLLQGVESETPQGYSNLVRGRGGLSFVSHLEERMDWTLIGVTGVEIYNTHADFKGERRLVKSLANPLWLLQAADLFRRYPRRRFRRCRTIRPTICGGGTNCKRRRCMSACRRTTASNVGVVIRLSDAGKPVLEDGGGKSCSTSSRCSLLPGPNPSGCEARRRAVRLEEMDPYECSLRHVATHLLASDLAEAAVWESLSRASVRGVRLDGGRDQL